MKKLNRFKHAPKSDFQTRTTVTLKKEHLAFIKEHDLNLSRIVRAKIDRLISLWKKQSRKID